MAQWGNTRYHFPTPQSSYPPSTSRGRRRFQGGRRQGARFQPRNPQSFSVARTRLTITPAMEQEILDMNIEYLKTQDSEFKCIVAKSCQAAVFFYYGGKYIGTGPQATGCLFLYARNSEDDMGLIIFNRIGLLNWRHIFVPRKLETFIDRNYLLFKDEDEIRCIWFYEYNDAGRFGEILRRAGANQFVDENTAPGPSHDQS